MPREGEREEREWERARGENDERKRGFGSGATEVRGAYRRDYRTKLRTKVIRPWRHGRVFGITGGLCAVGFIFLRCEIMDWDRANALLSSLCPLLSSFIDAFVIISRSHPDIASNYQLIFFCIPFSQILLLI